MDDRIKVLVVDDSALMRTVISEILSSDPSMTVVGTAKTGLEAINRAVKLRPDVMTLDIEMPELSGLEALRQIMRKAPTKVIMLSGLSSADVTYDALSSGAVDFVAKPAGPFSPNLKVISDELLSKVKMAASVDLASLPSNGVPRAKTTPASATQKTSFSHVVMIGSSTGGPAAVERVLRGIPRSIDAVLIVVQHLPVGFSDSFVKRLARMVQLDVQLAETGQKLRAGNVYVAPAGWHMTLANRPSMGPVVQLDRSRQISGLRPAADRTMESVAAAYKDKSVGVLLTGMGSDGARGMKLIKEAGGFNIAQDEKSCVVFGMPRAAIELGVVDKVVPLPEIAGEIRGAVERKARRRRGH